MSVTPAYTRNVPELATKEIMPVLQYVKHGKESREDNIVTNFMQ